MTLSEIPAPKILFTARFVQGFPVRVGLPFGMQSITDLL
jgi:hypothetical protein